MLSCFNGAFFFRVMLGNDNDIERRVSSSSDESPTVADAYFRDAEKCMNRARFLQVMLLIKLKIQIAWPSYRGHYGHSDPSPEGVHH